MRATHEEIRIYASCDSKITDLDLEMDDKLAFCLSESRIIAR